MLARRIAPSRREIDEELQAFASPLHQPVIDALRGAGVPTSALAQDHGYSSRGAAPYGRALAKTLVHWRDDARFDFSDSDLGERAIVVPIRSDDGDFVDILAFNVKSGRVATAWGAVPCAGLQSVGQHPFLRPVHIASGVVEWLRRGRDCILPVDLEATAGWLRDAGRLTVATPNARRALTNLMRATLPPISIERGAA